MLYNFDEITLCICLAVLAALLTFLAFKKRSFSSLLFFLIFGIYMIGVIYFVIFPIWLPGPDAGSFIERLHWNSNFVNMLPFAFDCSYADICREQMIDNIILTMPFGFGIRFLAPLKAKDFLWLPFAVGVGLEISQFVISQGGFHTLDINDMILNATGVVVGYILFRIFGWFYRGAIHLLKINPRWLFAYVYRVVSD